MMNTRDTIAAVASGVGGAIGVIRISGPSAAEVARRVWRGRDPALSPRELVLGNIGGEPALAVLMPGPRSYTGDDVAELQLHGSPLGVASALRACFAAGARPAEPGEFTFRAFVNGKLDLTRAEAVADLIAARGEAARRMAERQLAGRLEARVAALREEAAGIRAEAESHLDFPDEELEWDPDLPGKARRLSAEIAALHACAAPARLCREGVEVAIGGRPNAGKSSLLNALLGFDRAIVSEIPGTTRDTVSEMLDLGGIPVRLIDTAGLRTGADAVEQLGIERSRRELAAAAIRLWVLDAATPERAAELAEFAASRGGRTLAVWNKIDCCADAADLPDTGTPAVRVSAKTGAGLDDLRNAFRKLVWNDREPAEPDVAPNERHAAELTAAEASLSPVPGQLENGDWELAAMQLGAAIAALGRITGETAEPDLLERIFSRFCIGK